MRPADDPDQVVSTGRHHEHAYASFTDRVCHLAQLRCAVTVKRLELVGNHVDVDALRVAKRGFSAGGSSGHLLRLLRPDTELRCNLAA